MKSINNISQCYPLKLTKNTSRIQMNVRFHTPNIKYKSLKIKQLCKIPNQIYISKQSLHITPRNNIIVCCNDRSNNDSCQNSSLSVKKQSQPNELALLTNSTSLLKNALLTLILFSKLMIYTIVRDMKDVMLVTQCGADAIPIIKTWINFPISVLSMIYFTKLIDNGYSFNNIYRRTYIPIVSLYVIVGLILYPNRHLIEPMLTSLPMIQNSFMPTIVVKLIENWVTVLFYTLSNTWGSVVISLLFWSLANQYTNVEEAKRIYPLFGFVGNAALISAGTLISLSGNFFVSDWNLYIQFLMSIVMVFGIISFGLCETLFKKFDVIRFSMKRKKKISFSESIKNTLSNPFITNMVLMMACYGGVMSMYETVWKGYMKLYFTNPIEYSKFIGLVSTLKGVTTMMFMILSSLTLSHMKWKHAVLLTPCALLSLGITFFSSIFTDQSLYVIVYIGASISIFAKGLKYSFFDPNKEIAYINMDEDVKTKGKATVDVLSSPVGKSSSSLFQQLLIMYFGTICDASSYVALVFIVVCLIWINAVNKINKYVET